MNVKRAQAVVEMGVFASILLVIIITGVVMMVQVNDEVGTFMEAFRGALKEARPLDLWQADQIEVAPQGYTLLSYKQQRMRGQSVSFSEVTNNRYRQFQSGNAPLQQHLGDANVYWFTPTIAQLAGADRDFADVVREQTKVMYKINADTWDITPYETLAQTTHNIVDKDIWLRTDAFFQWKRKIAIFDQAGISFRRKQEDVADVLMIGVRDDKNYLGSIRQVIALTRSAYGQKEKEVYKMYEDKAAVLNDYDMNEYGVMTKRITEGVN